MNNARVAAVALRYRGGVVPCGGRKVPWRGVVPPEQREACSTEPLLEWSLGAGHVAAIVAIVVAAARVLAYFS